MTSSNNHIIRLLLLMVFVIFSCTTWGQKVNLDKKITIVAENQPLSIVLEQISEKGNINFGYSSQNIPLNKKINIFAQNKTIKEILNEVFEQCDVTYNVVEKQIILKPKKKPPPQKEEKKPKFHTVSGFLRDRTSGEILIGATIYVKEILVGTITNAYGFYSITVPEGKYTLEFSYIGYKKATINLDLFSNKKVTMDLETDETILDEVIINANDLIYELGNSQMSTVNLNHSTLDNIPEFMGETDIIKSLQSIPGIKSYGDGSTNFYVRGGNRDQNLILIDEAPIFNPSHLLGFYSSIVSEAVNDIKVYTGDIPAEHGGRISSLIDVKTKEGNMNKFSANGNLGVITNTMAVEGPIVKEWCSYYLSFRGANLNWLFRRGNPNVKLNFYDINAKVNFRIAKRDRFYLAFYSGNDVFGDIVNPEGFGISWGNFAGTFRWNHVFGERFFSNTTLTGSNYQYFLYSDDRFVNYWNSTISNVALKWDLTFFMNPNNTFRFGTGVAYHGFDPGNLDVTEEALESYIPIVPQKESLNGHFYFSNKHKLTEKFTARYGLRIPTWSNYGPTFEYEYDENYEVLSRIEIPEGENYYNHVGLEPRISLNYKINKLSSIKTSYNRTIQYIHLLSNSVSPFTTLEVWMPSSNVIQPQKADIVALGYKRYINWGVNFTVESFYKKMYNQIDYAYQADMLLNPSIEGELRFGAAKAYGIEFLFQKNHGKFSGWLGYTYSRVIKTIQDVNDSRPYPAFYDRPHDISIYLTYQPWKRWSFSTNWIYTSGAAISTPTSFYYYDGYTVPVYTRKNNDRLPAYHRLDISARFHLNKEPKGFQHSLTLGIFNVYARRNPVSINYNKTYDDNGELRVPANYYSKPEIYATDLSLLGFIPSFSYKFSF